MSLHAEIYPPDWDEIAAFIKEANLWQCQACDRQCRQPGEPYDGQDRTLTVAHYDHVYDAPEVFVACLCSPCHLRHDAAHTWSARHRMARLRQQRAGQLILLKGDDAP